MAENLNCLPCPSVKLVGCNLDSGIHYLSPRAKLKCRDLCRPTCRRCRRTRATVIRPGDGERFDQICGDPCINAAIRCGPPFNFGFKHQSENVQGCAPRGFYIERDCCQYPPRDYIEGNAVDATREVPKIPLPRVALDCFGRMTEYCPSGFGRNYVFNKNFGRMPQYLCCVKDRLAFEDYKLRCVLGREGRVCDEPGHNIMNQMGLLDSLYSKNPLVWRSKFNIKPQLAVRRRQRTECCRMPHPCFYAP